MKLFSGGAPFDPALACMAWETQIDPHIKSLGGKQLSSGFIDNSGVLG